MLGGILPHGKQINKHLHIKAVHYVAQLKSLAARFIVNNSDEFFAVYIGTVNSVHAAVDF